MFECFDRNSWLQGPGCAKTTFVCMGFVDGSVLIEFVMQALMPATSVRLRVLRATRVYEHLTADKAYTSVNVCRSENSDIWSRGKDKGS